MGARRLAKRSIVVMIQRAMERVLIVGMLVTHSVGSSVKMVCPRKKPSLEMGTFNYGYVHMESAVIENRPVTISEGQVYVYENDFPGHTIKYIHVDNLAVKTCGATVSLKAGGVGTSSVMLVLVADGNNEIRSVIDIWGTTDYDTPTLLKPMNDAIFQKARTINHNRWKVRPIVVDPYISVFRNLIRS